MNKNFCTVLFLFYSFFIFKGFNFSSVRDRLPGQFSPNFSGPFINDVTFDIINVFITLMATPYLFQSIPSADHDVPYLSIKYLPAFSIQKGRP